MPLMKCPECGKLVATRFAMHDCPPKRAMKNGKIKHGIEPRFDQTRKLRLLSYAVWLNGFATVSHATTRGRRRHGYIEIAYKQEQRNNPQLPII